MARETDARMVIDQLLKDAGWDIFDKVTGFHRRAYL